MKKVLIIPSWYPYSQLPHAGNFIINQANALADNGLAEISILNWGQLEYQLVLRSPLKSLSRFYSYLGSKSGMRQWPNSICEYRIPHLTWTQHLLGGNLEALIPKLKSLAQFDLIHAHVSYPAGYLAMKLSEQTGIPFIITEHSGPFPLPGLSKKGIALPLVSEPISAAKAVIAVSSALAEEIRHQTGRESLIIPNLVDGNFFKPLEHRIANNSFSLFALASLVPSKGIIDLVEAIKILSAKGIDLCLKIGGAGSLATRITKEISRHHLQQKLVLLGQLKPPQALTQYQNCDCFVMPSHHESFSVVLLEALACGKPVIATACGGPTDIVTSDNGLLVPPRNPLALAEAIQKMMQTYQNYDPACIRDHCVQTYSSEVIASQIAKVYNG